MRNFIIVIACFIFTHIKAQQVNEKIQEVYASFAHEYVFSKPYHLNYLTDIIVNRVKVFESPILSEDKYPKLSQVPLLNKYNPSLSYDAVFDPSTFNPIKYNFNFSTNKTVIYRVDNTNYIIEIKPQNIYK